MRIFLRITAQVLVSTLVLFAILEVLFRVIGAPGASRFAEKVVIQERLTPHKPKGEYRIFAYGESTMHGSHYGPTSNPGSWLEAYLKDFLPGKNIRVVNFARIGHGSDFIYETFRDTLVYQPDLAIFYMGHNDFLNGNRKYEIEAEQRTWRYKIRDLIRRSYLISTVYRWVVQKQMEFKEDRSDDQIEFSVIETPPSTIGAENSTPANGAFYKENIQFFKANMIKILDLGARHHLPMLFFKPVSNLKDFAPFLSVHMKPLSPDTLAKWDQLFHEGKLEQVQGHLEEASSYYKQAYAIDDTYAELSYRLGQIDYQLGDMAEARRLFEQARDNDAIIFRAPKDILAVFDELVKTNGLQMIDTEALLAPRLPGGIMGEPLIEDNVHFSIEGHSITGRGAAQEIADRDWIAPKKEWKFDRERSFEDIKRSLGIDDRLMLAAYLRMVNYFGSRYENRIRFSKKALAISPNNPRALRYLAWTYWLSGDQGKALETYRILSRTHPDVLAEVFKLKPKIRKAFEDSLKAAPIA